MMKIRTGRTLQAALLAGSLSLAACTGDKGDQGPVGDVGTPGPVGPVGPPGNPGAAGTMKWLSFADVGFPRTNAEKHQVRASSRVNVNGTEHPISFTTILRGGQDPARPERQCDLVNSPNTCLNVLLSRTGQPLRDDAGQVVITNAHDNTSFIQMGGKTFMYSSTESFPAGMFVTSINQDANGNLTATATKAIDTSPIDGFYYSCAGAKTSWNTHMASEEFPPDARFVQERTNWSDLKARATSPTFAEFKLMAQYFGVDLTDANMDGVPDGDYRTTFLSTFSPYFAGFPVEITLDENGNGSLKKHYAMGRGSVEVPYVMPDNKTVLLTDDGANVGLYMFVSDKEKDLSAGTLYAMRAYQTSPRGGAIFTADIEWINLGHATNDQIHAFIHPSSGARITFADIFEAETPNGDGTCPTAGFKAVRGANSENLECLKLKPGMELPASRFETRRYATLQGATTELNKEEGLTYDPDSHTVYIALTEIAKGMISQPGGDDHISVAANACGGVFGLNVGSYTNADGVVVTQYAPLNWYPVIMGVPMSYPAGSEYTGNSCSVNGLASPDNVTYLPGYNTLIIGEDTSGHQNDAIWSFNTVTKKLERIMTTPYGSETTSPYWYPDLGGHGYLIGVVQHPYGETDAVRISDPEATGRASWVGVFGPFPPLK